MRWLPYKNSRVCGSIKPQRPYSVPTLTRTSAPALPEHGWSPVPLPTASTGWQRKQEWECSKDGRAQVYSGSLLCHSIHTTALSTTPGTKLTFSKQLVFFCTGCTTLLPGWDKSLNNSNIYFLHCKNDFVGLLWETALRDTSKRGLGFSLYPNDGGQ